MASSKFSKRIGEIKRIERENFRLAHRLYRNRPCISAKKLEMGFREHLRRKQLMSRYNTRGVRKSTVVCMASKRLATGMGVSRKSRTRESSTVRDRPKTHNNE